MQQRTTEKQCDRDKQSCNSELEEGGCKGKMSTIQLEMRLFSSCFVRSPIRSCCHVELVRIKKKKERPSRNTSEAK